MVVSPHFDDGVFACGDLLAEHPGSTVITVFGDGPASGAVAEHREEDQEALEELESSPVWLPFWERRYGRTVTAAEIQPALEAAILMASPAAVAIPLGLLDRDHLLSHEAALPLVRRYPNIVWLAYEEALSRVLADGELLERLTGLARLGIRPTRAGRSRLRTSARKRRAIECYRSQLRRLDESGQAGYVEATSPERFWRLLSEGSASAG